MNLSREKGNRGGAEKIGGFEANTADLGQLEYIFPPSIHDGLEFGIGVFHFLYKNIRGGGMSWATRVGDV